MSQHQNASKKYTRFLHRVDNVRMVAHTLYHSSDLPSEGANALRDDCFRVESAIRMAIRFDELMNNNRMSHVDGTPVLSNVRTAVEDLEDRLVLVMAAAIWNTTLPSQEPAPKPARLLSEAIIEERARKAALAGELILCPVCDRTVDAHVVYERVKAQ